MKSISMSVEGDLLVFVLLLRTRGVCRQQRLQLQPALWLR